MVGAQDRRGSGKPGSRRQASPSRGRTPARGRPSGPPPKPGRRPGADGPEAAEAGPPIPTNVSARQLSGGVRRQLSGLPDRVAELVGSHLVMAGQLIDEDPRRAYEHARAARSLAARVGVVREACGETAYACERYADALAELRAARRINGLPDYLPVMADCERALGRPERAIRLSQDPGVERLDAAGKAEMTVVTAGARRDLGQLRAALQVLEAAPLGSQAREPWVARLRYAYADALEAAGRHDHALEWFHRTVGVDDQSATDADERIAALESDQPPR